MQQVSLTQENGHLYPRKKYWCRSAWVSRVGNTLPFYSVQVNEIDLKIALVASMTDIMAPRRK